MKTLLIVIVTIIYTLGAVAVYSTDRELGRANCWNNKRFNEAFSSAMAAVTWPVYALVAGSLITMTGNPHPFDCKRIAS